MKIAIITQEPCHWCDMLKNFLEINNLAYTTFDAKGFPEGFLKEMGFKTVPQLFINGNRIGGYDDVVKWFND